MSRLQRLGSELFRLGQYAGRSADALETLAAVFSRCAESAGGAGNGVAAPPVGSHPIAVQVPTCGTCGDTGRIPNEGPLRWSDPRFDEDDSIVCPDCGGSDEPAE